MVKASSRLRRSVINFLDVDDFEKKFAKILRWQLQYNQEYFRDDNEFHSRVIEFGTNLGIISPNQGCLVNSNKNSDYSFNKKGKKLYEQLKQEGYFERLGV